MNEPGRKPPRQLRLFSGPLRPNRQHRKRGLRWIKKARAELERSEQNQQQQDD